MPDDVRFTPAAIRPLVSHQNVQGRHLILTFTCPIKRTHVQARYTAPQSSGFASVVANQTKTTVFYEVRRQVLVMIRQMMGYSFAGQIATSAASTAMNTMSSGSSGPSTLSGGEIEAGLVEAFKQVQGQFVWTGDRWVSRAAAPHVQDAMTQQLEAGPVASTYDQLILARMMVEVAASHGGISSEEEAHLADAIDPSFGSLAALADRPPLTRAELSEASPGKARQSMLAAVWALALADEHEAPAERELLEGFAAGLGADATEARALACTFVMDQALERAFTYGGHDRAAREELYAVGARIGMSRTDVERAEARYQKRKLG